MASTLRSSLRNLRQTPIAACLAPLFALSAPTVALAGTVTKCDDDGTAGTLRYVIAATADGGTVDFTPGLVCSKITLAGFFEIPITQNSLTIDATAAQNQVTIDAENLLRTVGTFRVMRHTGTGELLLKRLILENGYVNRNGFDARGACLYSSGNVTLNGVSITQCQGNTIAPYKAEGGGVWVTGNLTMQNSHISFGGATSPAVARGGGAFVGGNLSMDGSSLEYNGVSASGNALGGGAFVAGNLSAVSTGNYTSISHNGANSDTSGMSKGGGVYVGGTVDLHKKSGVTYNLALATAEPASGGGIYAVGQLTLASSIVTSNHAAGKGSRGGGIYAKGNSSISYSSISSNKVFGSASIGGGMQLLGATNSIVSSTIANNVSEYVIGGVNAYGGGAGILFELKNSTISGNSAAFFTGGLYADAASVRLFNSTIAFNYEAFGSGHSPGVQLSALNNPMAANLQSTLISNNFHGGTQNDLTILEATHSVTFNGGVLSNPANNLIHATLVVKLPTDTKIGVCPHLGPLRDNGGGTLTHALMSHSAAIDAGNDTALGSPPYNLFDQRGSAATNGTANYTRFSGVPAIADIGAYEVQQNEIVFNSDFEGCPP